MSGDDTSQVNNANKLLGKSENVWRRIVEEKNYPFYTPKMVFSVIGDSNNFVPKPWKKFVFQTALIDAAENAGETWILTRGRKFGVSNIVKEAYDDYIRLKFHNKKGEFTLKDHGSKSSVDVFENPERRFFSKIPIKLLKIDQKDDQEKEKITASISYKADIDVIGVQMDGDEKFHDFLVEFESYLSKQLGAFFNWEHQYKGEFGMRVQVILVVVEGDMETLSHIQSALSRNIPVLVIKGSGKAADLIASYLEQDNEETIHMLAPVLFGTSFDENELESLKGRMNTITSKKYLLSVFDVNCDDPHIMSKIIGEAIVRAWAIRKKSQSSEEKKQGQSVDPQKKESKGGTSNNHLKTVTLAVIKDTEKEDQNYVRKFETDIHVLSTKFTSPSSLPLYFYCGYQLLQEKHLLKPENDQPKILMLEALKSNRSDYVQVLLEHGITFNKKDLSTLYQTTVKCKCDFHADEKCLHMQWILRQSNYEEANNLLVKHKEKHEDVSESAISLVLSLLGYGGIDLYEDILLDENEDNGPSGRSVEKDVLSDLLLWSLFANRRDISEILWLRSENHLLTALVCAVLLKKLAKKANNVKEQVFSKSLEEHASMFSNYCISMLDELYEQDAQVAMKIVDKEATVWGIRTTPLTFAYENYELDFVAHTCSQRRLNRIWYKKLAPDFKPFLKSILRKPKKVFFAPFTRYLINYFLFLLMLIAFSAFVMTSIDDYYYRRPIARVWEYYIYIWAGGDLIEEVKNGLQIFRPGSMSHRGYWPRTKRYLNDFWNFVDLLSYIILIIALFTRHQWESEPFTIARRLFSVSLLLMYLRYLQVFLMSRRLGPTLIMIKEMLKDLLYFLVIAAVAIVGVGIYYHANLYPNHINLAGLGTWDTWHIWKILYYPYWQLYGESMDNFLEVQELPADCTSNRSIYETDPNVERCPERDPTVPILSAAYILISNLLLVNLVIAMFSYTFDKVMANSERLWRFERYTVITDYKGKVPSPFNFLIRPYQIVRYLTRCCKGKCKVNDKDIQGKKRRKLRHRLHMQKIIAVRCTTKAAAGQN